MAIDKNVESEFIQENKLKVDEKIVYAAKKKFYIDEYDQYDNLYRVVTINERNGIVTKYLKQGDDPVGGAWFCQTMH